MFTADFTCMVQDSLGEVNSGLVAWGMSLDHGLGEGQILALQDVQIMDEQLW
jgi:hypothetical protein